MNKKKIMSLIMALVMLVGVFSPLTAFADNANEPGLTLPTKTSGTFTKDDLSETVPDSTDIVIRKIKADSFDITKGIEHNGGKIDFETKLKALGKNVDGLNGVKFTYYKVSQAQFKAMKDAPSNYATKKQVEEAYTDLANKGKETSATATVNGEKGYTTVTIPKADNGYYWFVESDYIPEKGGPESISSTIAVPFGITIPLTNVTKIENIDGKTYDQGTIYLKKVHVYPKNVTGNEPKPKKTVGNEVNKSETHEVGKVQTWYLQATIPGNIADYEEFEMNDVFFKGLTYKGNVSVYMGYDGADQDKSATKVVLEAGTDYTLTQPAENTKFTTEIPADLTQDITINNAKEKFQVKLTKTGIEKLAKNYQKVKEAADKSTQDDKDVKIYAKVDTVINEDAKMSVKIPNTYDLEFKIKNKDKKKKKPEETPHVKTGGKKFKKVDEFEKTKPLQDAVFTIKHQKDGTEPTTAAAWKATQDLVWTDALIKANADAIKAGKFATKKSDNENIYNPTSDSNQPEAGKPIYVRSTTDGTFEIKGLEYSSYQITKWDKATSTFVKQSDVKNYYALKEVKAPKDGDIEYALRDDYIPFTIDDTSYYKDATKVKLEAADPQVVDNKKLSIPQTGGMGTVLFTIVGISLMAGAVIAMKKNREEA